MDASFPSLSVVTASCLVACSWALVCGGLGELCHEPHGLGGLGTATGQLRPSSRLGPGAADAEGLWMGLRGAPSRGLVVWSWSWIMVCGRRRSSSHQLHLDWVVVADCQGLEEGKRWGGVMQGFSKLLAVLVGLAGQL